MAIDTRTPDSPGWWLAKTAKVLRDKQDRLDKLRKRYEGDAPIPEGPPGEARKVYEAFVRKARTNYAELVVEALRERLKVTGFRTAAAGDELGDAEARRLWDENRGDVLQSDVHEWGLSMSEAYTIVGLRDGRPVITAEDPRQMASIHDPVSDEMRAALKMFHDDDEDRDFAYLYRPGRVFVAFVDRKTSRLGPRFSPATWSWLEDRGGAEGERFQAVDGTPLPDLVPAVRFRNRRGVAEFEPHLDTLDRIDYKELQGMVIATMQAFRQRAIKGAPLKDPNTGDEIPWETLLAADPGSVWLLPGVVEMWESGQVDLSGIIKYAENDIKILAAVTRTPLPMLMPGDGAESAEGASFKREGLVFKAEDRIARFTEGWKDTVSLMFRVAGEPDRADRSQLEVLWAAPERRSLAERADANSKLADLPWATRMRDIMGYSPTRVVEMQAERAADALLAATFAPQPPAVAAEPQRRPAPEPEPA